MADAREFDVVIYGATGFTGRLVAEYFVSEYRSDRAVRWALGGRSEAKLEALRAELSAPADTPLIVADADDAASLASMVGRTKVVLTTVGPYQLVGSGLVAACAQAGTDYVDLCGEPAWMREVIEAHGEAAKQSGARIVLSCGFDSIPFDLGVFFAQETARRQLGAVVPRIKGRVRSMVGTFSGGTAASFEATMAAIGKDPAVIQVLIDPFALTPGFEGPAQPAGNQPMEEEGLGWVAPFIMAAINTKNVHRSNMLLGHPYGRDFVYDEMMLLGPGEEGKAAAFAVAGDNPLAGDRRPPPGGGPSRQERQDGSFDILFVGEAADGRSVRVAVSGDMDPGYGSTSKMIAESALCLLDEVVDAPGGVLTPAAVFGAHLIKRLESHRVLRFAVEG